MVSYTASLQTQATVVTLTEAKAHLRITHDYEDDVIQAYINSAVIAGENYTGRFLNIYDVTCKTDEFTDGLRLQYAPLVDDEAVVIKYYDSDNSLQTLDATWYSILHRNGEPEIYFDDNKTLPSLYNREDAVVITYQSGIPEPFKQYVKLMITFFYENRSDSVDKLPRFTNTLLKPYKKWA